MDGTFANPASRSHIYGWQAEEKVEHARGQVAELLSADPREIVWTSGATESNNLALKGAAAHVGFKGHIITSAVEHKAVIDPALWLERQGMDVTFLAPQADGRITVEQVQQALRDDTVLVSIMHINNEVGSINPVAAIGQLCRQHDVLLHVDAAQSAGKLSIDVMALHVDLLSLSAHKFYGPKGVGVLYVRRAIGSRINAQMHGGGHERGLRSGTLPTHQIVGIGVAAEQAVQNLDAECRQLRQLRDRLWQGLSTLPGIYRHGVPEHTSPHHLNVCFAGVDGESLLLALREVAVSSGSACTSASVEPSYVLKAMGVSDADAHSSLRFSVGRFTCEADIDRAIEHITTTVAALQSLK